MLGKFRIAVFIAAMLWMIVLVQIIVTRIYVSHTDYTQAFARNRITVLWEETEQQNADSRNYRAGNTCMQGMVHGKLSRKEMAELARDLFQTLGGGEIQSGSVDHGGNYYVAYGYTTGIQKNKRVNGKRINMNVAISYDEKKNVTNVVFGTPIINSDF